MIKIEVIKAQDSDLLGEFVFYKDKIYIGPSPNCDLFIPEVNIVSNLLNIQINEGKLLLHLPEEIEYIHVNNRRTVKFKQLKTQDIISINNFSFKILEFNKEEFLTKKEKLNSTLQEIKKNDPQLLEIIAKLSENHEKLI